MCFGNPAPVSWGGNEWQRGGIMRLPRVTVRGLMALVIAFGIVFHLGLTAYRVYSANEYHAHTWINNQSGKPSFAVAANQRPPFWPRYWRCLLGRPWKGLPLCPRVDGRLREACEFAQPEIHMNPGRGRDLFLPTRSQLELERQIKNPPR
jgi:hypothetical protein